MESVSSEITVYPLVSVEKLIKYQSCNFEVHESLKTFILRLPTLSNVNTVSLKEAKFTPRNIMTV